ncbi:cytochrome P450 [Brevibacterium antiquum]|uniref:Cytochrome P450 n=1 Tax=Brevibacterium antiquum TaxID=234835 RepID=A0A2H1J6H5_9MICO|nr:cytochrome P450 [Brevibacterium antiquum]SMX82961.1 Cytochrome P450 [Brevibacterium antiquum]
MKPLSKRRAIRDDENTGPPVDYDGQMWRIRSFDAARAVLRARDQTTQAGFTAEKIPRGYFRHHPILISDGEDHDAQRREVARFFAPSVVAEKYGDFINDRAQAVVDNAVMDGRCRLDEVALHYSVDVTATVVGLTESSIEGMAKRLVGFFRQPPVDLAAPAMGRTRRQWMQAAINGLIPIVSFYCADVRPAIRSRRRRERNDVLSHLLTAGYGTADILVECVTYGTAGMVTTREFITMACWHLLTNAELGREYVEAALPARLEILEEIIRLDPVVGHLYRRAQADIDISDNSGSFTISDGDLIDVCVRQTNTDPQVMGSDPETICPGRGLNRATPAAGMSFSDGAHKCPGQALALYETDALVHKLLAHRPRILKEPTISWDNVIEGYRLRGLDLSLMAPSRPASVSRQNPSPTRSRLQTADSHPSMRMTI